MTLSPGTRLGPYEVTAAIGAGGMGEIFRARDTTLNRDVAIKVLPAAMAGDPERLARFKREAQVLASLSHSNIAHVYGFEGAALPDGSTVHFLAMEMVEGEDLSERLKRGAIPVDEVIAIAKQIAEGLEEAHEHGIIHRDLKPANIKVRSDGTVKVLDFGLAKAMDPAGASASNPDVSHSPTLTHQGTSAGMIVGTAAYMSPEQAKGKTVDKRADIWAFGVVLYEMLSGTRLFKGEDVSDTLAAVLRQDIDLAALAAATPPRLKRLVERCLDRDLKARLRDIGEARVKLVRIEAGGPEHTGSGPAAAGAVVGSDWQRALPWLIASGLGVIALRLWAPWQPTPEPATAVRLSVELGADVSLGEDRGPAAILSPDGKLLAFTGRKAVGEKSQLYVRRLDQLEAAPLSGTEDAHDPFFSPDGQWIAFFAEGKLKKVAAIGGAAVTLCAAPDDRGGTWSEDDTIVFTPTIGVGLSRVSSAGGTPEILTTTGQDATENSHRWPQILPGGKAVLFTAGTSGDYEGASLIVLSLPNGPRKVLMRGGYHGRYLKSGHIVYIHEGTLFGAPFDLGRLEFLGQPAPVLADIMSNSLNAGARFAFSDRGTLAFQPGQSLGGGLPILWMGEDGATRPLRGLAGRYADLAFSPDGQRLAMDLREAAERDVWVYEGKRDTMSRLTFDPGTDMDPVWTPGGNGIAFASTRADKTTANIYWQRADGTGEAQRLTESKNDEYPKSWHPGGEFLAFTQLNPTSRDIMILPIEGDEASGFKPGKPTVFLNSPFLEDNPAFSPDGRWLAYDSTESGRSEVYVRPFPGPGGKWQVSSAGGRHPTWSRTRKALHFATNEGTLMVAAYTVDGNSFRAEKPGQWSPGRFIPRGNDRLFDLHPDGERVAIVKPAEDLSKGKLDRVVLIQNFFEELRRTAPRGKR